jgi:hypothetical protein
MPLLFQKMVIDVLHRIPVLCNPRDACSLSVQSFPDVMTNVAWEYRIAGPWKSPDAVASISTIYETTNSWYRIAKDLIGTGYRERPFHRMKMKNINNTKWKSGCFVEKCPFGVILSGIHEILTIRPIIRSFTKKPRNS